MDESLRALLASKLDDPDPVVRAHARARLDAAPPPAYPSIATQAANLAGAAVRFVASGLAIVDQAEFDRRHATCEACPSGLYDAEQDRCRACSCYLAVKPWSKAESCPKGHW